MKITDRSINNKCVTTNKSCSTLVSATIIKIGGTKKIRLFNSFLP